MTTPPAPQPRSPASRESQEPREAQSAPPYVTGVNVPVVVLGILCVVTGALTIAQVVTGSPIDWGTVGPPLFTGLGLALILAGIVGLVRRRRRARWS